MSAKGNKGDTLLTVHFIRGAIPRLIHEQQGLAQQYKGEWAYSVMKEGQVQLLSKNFSLKQLCTTDKILLLRHRSSKTLCIEYLICTHLCSMEHYITVDNNKKI